MQTPDLARMRDERRSRLAREMGAAGVDALALCTTPNVAYAGATGPCVVVRGENEPQPYDALRGLCASSLVVGADDLRPDLLDLPVVDAEPVVAAARLCKTADEVACIRRAQQINEHAMVAVEEIAKPGTHQQELTEVFLQRVFELGATENVVEPIWQVADVAAPLLFPLVGQDAVLADGDVVVVDTGIAFHGYLSDYGRTWGARREDFARWREITDAVLAVIAPGVTGRDLTRAALAAAASAGVGKPWLDHLYLAHGSGTASAEPPLVGTDCGDAFDEAIVLAPGMVLVLEPVVWTPGQGGYRAEETVVVTDAGYELLSERVAW